MIKLGRIFSDYLRKLTVYVSVFALTIFSVSFIFTATGSAIGASTATETATATPTASSTASATATGTASVTATTTQTVTPYVVNLGTSGTYGVLSSTFTSNGGLSAITGDAGFTTLSGSGTHSVTGTDYMPAPSQAGLDQGAALASLNGQSCTFTFPGGPIDLASEATHGTVGVYTPGVYCSNGAMNIGAGGTITLIGKGLYVFRCNGALNTTNNSSVALSGGAQACDVFWTPSQATTLGANTTFIGTVIDDPGITVGTTTAWTGRALAFGGTVTLDTDSISSLSCAGNPTSPILHGLKASTAPTSGEVFVFPAPVRGSLAKIAFYMDEAGLAKVLIYNERADWVASQENTEQAGVQVVSFNVSGFAPGVYFYKIRIKYNSGREQSIKPGKFIIIR